MKRFTKKIGALVLALTLVVGLCTSVSAAAWDSYFGANQDWYEGSKGELAGVSAKGFTAKMEAIGWGGVWGCRVFQKVSVKKGTTYVVSFKAKSTKLDKYMYVKVGSDERLAGSFWVKLPKGKQKTFTRAIKAAVTTNSNDELSFGIGGDFGDRAGIATDGDADVRYKQFKKDFGKAATYLHEVEGLPGDSSSATDVIVSNFSITKAPGKVTVKKAKALGGKKVKVTWSKAKGAKNYEVQVGSVKKKAGNKTSYTVKAKKKGKAAVKVRAIFGSYKAPWSKAKKVKVK